MRPFFIYLIPLLIILFGLNSIAKTAYATHVGNFANEAYVESLDGNCENDAVPTGCTNNTGEGCCQDYEAFYQANGHPTVSATCQNTCSYEFAQPNIDPRTGVCPDKTDPDTGTVYGGLLTFSCIYTTPTPIPTTAPTPPTTINP